MLEKFLKWLDEQLALGCIYVLGGFGQTGKEITEAWIKMREHYIASNYKRAIAFWKKQLAAGYTNLRAYDCNAPGNRWLYDNMRDVWPKRINANGMWGKCKKITRAQLKKGDWVFRGSAVRKTHVGYVWDEALNVIEVYGRDRGMIKRHVDVTASGKAYWTYFGRPKVFAAEIESGQPFTAITLDRLIKYEYTAKQTAVMRTGAGDKYAAKQGVPKGAKVAYMGKVGVWLRVYYSGVTGYVLASEFTKCDYMRGNDVTAIQQALKAVGNDPGVIDGVYGPQTVAAVVAFQTAKGLEIDGIVGPITWAALGL